MAWRLARSIVAYVATINALSPNRSKASDGGIGNAEHATRASDHNPWLHDKSGQPVVTAYDITNDPIHGISSQAVADALIASRDPRIKYVISNRKICSGPAQDHQAWLWRPYTGANPHDHHCHLSVQENEALFDSGAPWKLNLSPPPKLVAAPAEPAVPILKFGAKGADVGCLQGLLNTHGAALKVDEDFGAVTNVAVLKFQTAHDLVSDGVVGAYTWRALAAAPVASTIPREIHVVALYGLLGGPPIGYSLGLDAMIGKAVKAGLPVTFTSLSYGDQDTAYQSAAEAQKRGAAVVLTGHSLGASVAVSLANRLGREGKPASLIFTFDPTWNAPAEAVEGNIRAVNFYGTSVASPLGHDKLEAAPGFTGQIINIPVNALHQSVDDDPPAHECFVGELSVIAGMTTAYPDYSKLEKV